eukprot:PITA_08671
MEDVLTQDVNAVEKLLSNGINHLQVQDKYILPPSERPHLSEVSYSESIPVVDLQDLDGPNRTRVVEEIRHACEEDGFFQIVKHGVPEGTMKRMMEIAKEFFEMPVEDQACQIQYRVNKRSPISRGTILQKQEVLILHMLLYREIAGNYAMKVRALILRLLAAISEALGLDLSYLDRIFRKHTQRMDIMYYPPCPKPDITLGTPRHSDACGITVLMQGKVSGLQVVSNGRFRSVEHRAVTNASAARISIPTFYGLSEDAFIVPAASLVDEQHPAR